MIKADVLNPGFLTTSLVKNLSLFLLGHVGVIWYPPALLYP